MACELQYGFNKNQRGELQIEAYISLINPGETKAEDITREVIAKIEPVGRDEFNVAGQRNMKAKYKFIIWANEYSEETEALYNKKRLTIYRTYGPRDDEKLELYAGERIGNL